VKPGKAARALVSLLRLFKPLYGAAIMLSVTDRCQCACSRCAVNSGGGPGGPELSAEEIKSLLAEAAGLGAREVSFFGGEPLLRSELPELIREARSLGLRAAVTTNGLLLDGAMALKLKEAGLTIAGVSLDDPSPEIHDAGRGVPGLWQKAADGARDLVKLGVPVDISFCADRARLRDGRAAKMVEVAASLGARLRILSPMRAGRWNEKPEEALTPKDLEILRSLLAPGRAHWVIAPVDTPHSDFICSSLDRWKVDVTASGEVVACSYFPVGFGSIRSEKLAEIVKRMWKSPLYTEHRGCADCPLNDTDFRKMHSAIFMQLITGEPPPRHG
jgi:MoaA/NifB/PqqE/SkfB family radical SAM enzyme